MGGNKCAELRKGERCEGHWKTKQNMQLEIFFFCVCVDQVKM